MEITSQQVGREEAETLYAETIHKPRGGADMAMMFV